MSEPLHRSDAPPASVIAGRYRIERRLGRGGMGSVWRAEHLNLHSPVAVKLIDPSLAESEEARARFLREARSAAMLRSPHVVQVLDHGIDGSVPYLVMELLEGESLAAHIERLGKLTAAQTTRIMTHVARAMTRAHAAGIVHRDLKPENVFLVRDDDEEIAKVLDFGIAKAGSSLTEVGTATVTGAVMGTPHYMSPEQIEGSKQVDHRTDLWAMAVMTFECLTGKRPFDGPTLGGVLVQICARPIPVPSQFGPTPPAFDDWFLRATSRALEGRFQSAKELAEDLRRALEPGAQPAAQAPQAARAPTLAQLATETDPEPEPQAQPQLQPAITMSLSLPPVISEVPGPQRAQWRKIGAAAGIGIGLLGLGIWALPPAQPRIQTQSAAAAKPAPTNVAAPAQPAAPAAVARAAPDEGSGLPQQAPPAGDRERRPEYAAKPPSAAANEHTAVDEATAPPDNGTAAEPHGRAGTARQARASARARELAAAKSRRTAPPRELSAPPAPEAAAAKPAASDQHDLGF